MVHQTQADRRRRSLACIVGAVAAALSIATHDAAAIQFVIAPLTNDSTMDYPPRIAGNRVVWRSGSGASSEIDLWDGKTIVPLTINGVRDEEPAVDGSLVVWQQFDGNDWEIVRYNVDKGTVDYLTNNDANDRHPVVGSVWTVWVGASFESDEIFILPAQNSQLTGDTFPEGAPVMSRGDGGFAWVKYDDNDSDLFAYLPTHPDLPGVYQISDGQNGVPDEMPAIDKNRIAWVSGAYGSTEEIWRYDPLAPYPYLQVTNDNLRDTAPVIGPRRTVWEHFDGHDWEIYRYDEGDLAPTPLTNNAWHDWAPAMSGNLIVWVADDGNDTEIWYSDNLDPPVQLTDNTVDDVDPVVDGPRIAWRACDATDCDIMLAPEPRATAGVGAALAVLAALSLRAEGTARRRARCVVRSRLAP